MGCRLWVLGRRVPDGMKQHYQNLLVWQRGIELVPEALSEIRRPLIGLMAKLQMP